MNSPAVNRENCSTTTPPPPSFDPTNALPATVPFTPGIDQKLLSDTESSPDSTIFADMAPARSPKLFTEELGNTRLKGPTCLRPLTKERLAAMNPTPQTPSLPSVVSHVSKVPIRGRSNFPKCVQTTYTLDILPQSDVSIVDDLEPAVRAISSPCGNFIWGHIKIIRSADANMVDILQIILIHNNDNHDGNIRQETIAMFQPTIWDPRDLILEQKEVISVDQIMEEIRGWKGKVQSCTIVDERVQEHLMMVATGPAFPNGMGNEKRFPPPWDTKTWKRRVAERKAKESAYQNDPARRLSKLEVDGQWEEEEEEEDDDDDDQIDAYMADAALAALDSSESFEPDSISPSSTSELSQSC